MAENPLLPNTKLRELYALTERAETSRGEPRNRRAPRPEGIQAATLLLIEAGDFVGTMPGDTAAEALAAERVAPAEVRKVGRPRRGQRASTPPAQPPLRFANAVGIAQGLSLGVQQRLALLYAESGTANGNTEPNWSDTLRYATEQRLPLIAVVSDVGPVEDDAKTGTQQPLDALCWPAMSTLSRKTHLPVLSVDGTDAVAVYRAMQESVLRVRHGDGPVVLWCQLPEASRAGIAQPTPLQKLQRYLEARKISLPAAKANRTRRAL